MLWKEKLEKRIEVVRKQMEEAALLFGIDHPTVYQLSIELDELHNEWQRQAKEQKEIHIRPIYRKSQSVVIK